MAGTCKYCGADTWGRYSLCPDCRKERKRKGVYRSGWDSLGGEINLGERYVCKDCEYRWESKKKWGTPAVCPKCKSKKIISFYETPEGKEELKEIEEELREREEKIERKKKREKRINYILLILFVGALITFFIINPNNTNNTNKTNSSQEFSDQVKKECLSNNGFYFNRVCMPLDSIKTHKELCNLDGLKPIIFLFDSGGSNECYKGKIESDKLSVSQNTEVLNCENLGGVPVITDKVNCVELNSSNLSQEPISPEEELINSCISKFSSAGIFDLKKTNYQDDFYSASDWIRNNYENSALTQEQKEINIENIINNWLSRQDYPLVITWASKKINEQVIVTGFYYCNENGVI